MYYGKLARLEYLHGTALNEISEKAKLEIMLGALLLGLASTHG